MGNAASRQAGSTSESIEAFYAARAAEEAKLRATTSRQTQNAIEGEETPLLDENQGPITPPPQPADAEVDAAPLNASGSNSSRSTSPNQQIGYSMNDSRYAEVLRTAAASSRADYVMIHVKRALRALGDKSVGALNEAIEALRKIDYIQVAKRVCAWVKDHPWEIAAIFIPLILLGFTPAFLAAAGFTAGGVAAGSIAAGIQAGIGNVAAGSTFAILTSAAMGGYGVPIVFGTAWAVPSLVGWCICVWKRYRHGKK